RKAIMGAKLTLMMAEGPAVVADHAFTTAKIAQTGFERPLRPSREKVGIVNGFGYFPEQVPAARNTGSFIPDDFEHQIRTNCVVQGNGLAGFTHGHNRGECKTIRKAKAASGNQKGRAVVGGFHIVPPLTDDYIRQVISAFKEINPDYLIPGHCAGERFYDLV